MDGLLAGSSKQSVCKRGCFPRESLHVSILTNGWDGEHGLIDVGVNVLGCMKQSLLYVRRRFGREECSRVLEHVLPIVSPLRRKRRRKFRGGRLYEEVVTWKAGGVVGVSDVKHG